MSLKANFLLNTLFFFSQLASAAVIKRNDLKDKEYYTPKTRHSCHNTRSHSTTVVIVVNTATSAALSDASIGKHTDSPDPQPTLELSIPVLSISSVIFGTSVDAPATVISTATVEPIPAPYFTSVSSLAYISPTNLQEAYISSSNTLWKPAVGTTWHIELSGLVKDTTMPVEVFDLDVFETPASTISSLHASGKNLICYFSAGTLESWRLDSSSFSRADNGSAMIDWPNEWWRNTNSANVRSIMTKRIMLAKSKGYDDVGPENVDGYSNANGIGLTKSKAINYSHWTQLIDEH